MSEVVELSNHPLSQSGRSINAPKTIPPIFFNRKELGQILQVYGQMVAKLEWRDYAIGQTKTTCSFAIFHRTTDKPVFRIYKEPRLANKQGAFSVLSQSGQTLKRGKELAHVLKIFDKKRLKTVD